MNASEPRVRHRGYFISESGSDPELIDNDSAEGIYTHRAVRTRRARKAVAAASGRRQRHRAAISSHANDKKADAVRSAISTGNRRP